MEQNQWQIIVAERGFIFAGRVSREGDYVVIRDAFNIRRYSLQTHDGIGGLAAEGPRSKDNDILDAQPTTRIYVLAVIAHVECNGESWDKWHRKLLDEKSSKKR